MIRPLIAVLLLSCCVVSPSLHAEGVAVAPPAVAGEAVAIADLIGTWAIDVDQLDWSGMAPPGTPPEQIAVMKPMMSAMLGNMRFTITVDSITATTPDGKTDTKPATFTQTDANTVTITTPAEEEGGPDDTITAVKRVGVITLIKPGEALALPLKEAEALPAPAMQEGSAAPAAPAPAMPEEAGDPAAP